MIESTLSKSSRVVYIYSECYHLLNRSLNRDLQSTLIAHHTDQDRGDTSVHRVLWPSHKQESKCLMMYFMLVINRRDKNGFSVGEGKLTAKLVQLYKPAQISTSGLLCNSRIGFGDDCRCFWGGSLFCSHRAMSQSTAQTYGKVQQAGLWLSIKNSSMKPKLTYS